MEDVKPLAAPPAVTGLQIDRRTSHLAALAVALPGAAILTYWFERFTDGLRIFLPAAPFTRLLNQDLGYTTLGAAYEATATLLAALVSLYVLFRYVIFPLLNKKHWSNRGIALAAVVGMIFTHLTMLTHVSGFFGWGGYQCNGFACMRGIPGGSWVADFLLFAGLLFPLRRALQWERRTNMIQRHARRFWIVTTILTLIIWTQSFYFWEDLWYTLVY